ncbi:MAG: gamma-glutamyl-gamma-aminobutyrate hydrolase family protein [Truepera sp.]|nr:gamma-glutamyl-gamma-aminobutyrate hydrolase family protein [Truepera sp.]
MTRPCILLTTASRASPYFLRTDSLTGQNYSQAVAAAGGLPVMVSSLGLEIVDDYLDLAAGLLFTGGADLDPQRYGAEPHPQLGLVDPERDAFELALYRGARARGIPVLGICRGIQLINVAEGGTLVQHLPALSGTIQHEQVNKGSALIHTVRLEPSSRLARALGAPAVYTNTFHHQAIERLGHNLRATGQTRDGVIEAIEGIGDSFVLGVQWHPELSWREYPEHFVPFKLLLEAVRHRQLTATA